jgi:hypothetical protein
MLRFSECKELAHFVEHERLRAVLLRKGKEFLANVQKKENIFCFALKNKPASLRACFVLPTLRQDWKSQFGIASVS